MPTITINGTTIDRARVPSHLLAAYDQANNSVTMAQTALANWLKPLTVMQAPANFTGQIHCNGVGQSGYVYHLAEPGGAVLVDARDLAMFTSPHMGFTVAPSGPTASRPTFVRAGIVYNDTTLGQIVRCDGSTWSPITLV
jgi:hypothetical protein